MAPAPIKETQIDLWGPPLIAAGYTVFSVNHRGAPRFHYPAAIEDMQRAIRFVRSHATDYGIDAAHLGGLGGSSGGNLIGLAAHASGTGVCRRSRTPVNREPATLQAIVLRAAVTDLRAADFRAARPLSCPTWKCRREIARGREGLVRGGVAGHAGWPKSPPTLLIHGDADALVPYAQSAAMEAALRKVRCGDQARDRARRRTRRDFGGGSHPEWPNYFAETVAWFDKYLRGR